MSNERYTATFDLDALLFAMGAASDAHHRLQIKHTTQPKNPRVQAALEHAARCAVALSQAYANTNTP